MHWIRMKETVIDAHGSFLKGELREVDKASLRRLKGKYTRARAPWDAHKTAHGSKPPRKAQPTPKDKQLRPGKQPDIKTK